MEVGSKEPYPASAITNFAPHKFIFDGVVCCPEGLLQSFKYDDPQIQKEICGLSGIEAKTRGLERDEDWRKVQTLWWQGKAYDRHGPEYQKLLDRVYNTLADQCPAFREALLATGQEVLTHKIGITDPTITILTEEEFCSRLMKVRARLQNTT